MTLIINCATHEYAVQVSDRRLTKGGKVVEDDANKIVLFCGRMAFSYTGLAEIGKEKTDIWLTKILADPKCQSLSDAVRTIKARATESFQHVPWSKTQKRHAFVGIGWTNVAGKKIFQPIVCRISNFHDTKGTCLNEAQDQFAASIYILGEKDPFTLMSVGQFLPIGEPTELRRLIRRGLAKRVGPQAITRFLVDVVRKAATANTAVGENLLAVSLPRSPVERAAASGDVAVLATVPNTAAMSFLYVQAGRTDGIQYGPNVVCGGAALTEVKCGPLHPRS